MKIFITADPHFYHKNIIEYCKRPFKTVGEMDKKGKNWHKNMIKIKISVKCGEKIFRGAIKLLERDLPQKEL